MKTNHTPGPWRINHVGANGTTVVGSIHIAEVSTLSRETEAANARLIAAAPELLAWTVELLNQVKRDNPDKMAGVIEHVEKLIERATGGAV